MLWVPPGLTEQTMGSVPRHLLAQEQQSWEDWEPPPPQNAPQAPTDEGEAVRALRFPGREPARPWVIACIRAR